MFKPCTKIAHFTVMFCAIFRWNHVKLRLFLLFTNESPTNTIFNNNHQNYKFGFFYWFELECNLLLVCFHIRKNICVFEYICTSFKTKWNSDDVIIENIMRLACALLKQNTQCPLNPMTKFQDHFFPLLFL